MIDAGSLHLQVSDEDCFLVLASDGVWEFLENQDVVEIVDGLHASGNLR